MSRKFFRNVTMGSLLMMMIVVFAATASAQGQSLSDHSRARILFDFLVADKKLPAGEYLIGRGR